MLDAMLFRAADPDARYRIFERFYRLSPRLVARFYAGRSTTADRLRLPLNPPGPPSYTPNGAVGEARSQHFSTTIRVPACHVHTLRNQW